MERLEGLILRRDLPAGMSLPPEQAGALCRNLVDVHAELHAIDPDAAGLGELGRAEGYITRQVAGWSERYRAARTDDVPDNEALMRWLAATSLPRPRAPRSSTTTTSSTTSCSPRPAGAGASRACSTGRWRRSATR
jgi:aminoglycoside phosphotransferase (APT) family kinase protein